MSIKIDITTRHLNNRAKSKEIREYALRKIPRIEKYMYVEHEPSEIRLILESEKVNKKAEVIVNDGRYKNTASVVDEDHFAAIDKVIDTVIKQLRRNHDKISSSKRRIQKGTKVISNNRSRSKTKKINVEKLPLKPMSLEEARLQLEISSDKFIIFRNIENEEMNVLYQNSNSDLKLVRP